MNAIRDQLRAAVQRAATRCNCDGSGTLIALLAVVKLLADGLDTLNERLTALERDRIAP